MLGILYDPYMSCLSYLIYFIVPYLIQMTVVCIFALPMFSAFHQEILEQGKDVITKRKPMSVLVPSMIVNNSCGCFACKSL